MKGTGVARRYAKALIDLAARDAVIAEVGEQLRQHRDVLWANKTMADVLVHPGISLGVKRNLLTAILERTQPLPLVRNFFLVLLQKHRLRQLDLIVQHYERLANERLGRLAAEVVSAVELEPALYQAIAQKIKAVTGKQEVVLTRRLDPSLLGGVVVRVNHTVLDGSLRGQLARLREQLIGG
ncbi:MAG: ATP synthase subunit delta [Candidatus Tectimicrobiota bacterium]|nr:MAG: ATP synthase subunit delta [Candidatus Tectomicrobia bacterium]